MSSISGQIGSQIISTMSSHLERRRSWRRISRECDACRIVLDELRAVTVKAASLPPTPPSANLWPGIAARLERLRTSLPFRELAARRFSFTMPQLVAAAAALMLVSGGIRSGSRSTAAARRRYHPWWRPTGRASRRCRSSIVSLDDAINDLQHTLDAGRSQLDPETVNILESNLAAIDRAIDRSRRALDADPANVYLHTTSPKRGSASWRCCGAPTRSSGRVEITEASDTSWFWQDSHSPSHSRRGRRRLGPSLRRRIKPNRAARRPVDDQQLRRRSRHPYLEQGRDPRRGAAPVADRGEHPPKRGRSGHFRQRRSRTTGFGGLRHHRARMDAD